MIQEGALPAFPDLFGLIEGEGNLYGTPFSLFNLPLAFMVPVSLIHGTHAFTCPCVSPGHADGDREFAAEPLRSSAGKRDPAICDSRPPLQRHCDAGSGPKVSPPAYGGRFEVERVIEGRRVSPWSSSKTFHPASSKTSTPTMPRTGCQLRRFRIELKRWGIGAT